MNPFQAALIWFGGIAIFALMFEAADAVGGFLGWVVFGFTTIVLLYVTGVIGNKD